MNNQNDKSALVATKLLNKLARTELELAQSEVENDDLKAKISQLTQANQRLQAENQQLKSQVSAKTEEEKQEA